MPFAVRPIGPADLSACLDLAAARGWPRDSRKWSVVLDAGRGFGVDAPDGGLAATVVLTKTGPLASISMMLVASRFERQGLGRRLMADALAESGEAVVALHSTEAGRPLYESMGFIVDGGCQGHVGFLADDGGPASRPIAPPDLARVYELDAEGMGFDRRALLERLLFDAEHVHVTEAGYALGTESEGRIVIGPVIAADEEQARALVRGIAHAAGGEVRVDVDLRHPGLGEWCRDSGLVPQDPAPRLVLGGKPLPGDPARRFAVYNRALG
ncbi:GNAT family N-acetyltransferase [Amycolatopsis saalfeldensis]|uniref:Acetyltransferase (GNAT) domain-containing protein n=1 Tax=Amycolatopsis saalfeldensis TaxID=394193 RepID=A0A1H8YPG6_9PSEU|nr:GNAT family N-acetyltransferase [Amycolatopsis saalfeldensis]SEP54104.1 Acetyltransferase (GNAT) domain-containing protein [Amycolatopsis saalfeldensis]